MRTVPSSSNRGIIFFGSTTDIHIPGQHSTCACPERTSASESGKAPFASKCTQRRCGTEQVRCLLKAWAEASLVNDSTGWNRGERMRRNNVFRGVEDPSIVRQVRRLCLPGFPVPFFFFLWDSSLYWVTGWIWLQTVDYLLDLRIKISEIVWSYSSVSLSFCRRT